MLTTRGRKMRMIFSKLLLNKIVSRLATVMGDQIKFSIVCLFRLTYSYIVTMPKWTSNSILRKPPSPLGNSFLWKPPSQYGPSRILCTTTPLGVTDNLWYLSAHSYLVPAKVSTDTVSSSIYYRSINAIVSMSFGTIPVTMCWSFFSFALWDKRNPPCKKMIKSVIPTKKFQQDTSWSLSWWCIAFLNMGKGQRKFTPFGVPKTPTYNSSVQVYDMDGSSSSAIWMKNKKKSSSYKKLTRSHLFFEKKKIRESHVWAQKSIVIDDTQQVSRLNWRFPPLGLGPERISFSRCFRWDHGEVSWHAWMILFE